MKTNKFSGVFQRGHKSRLSNSYLSLDVLDRCECPSMRSDDVISVNSCTSSLCSASIDDVLSCHSGATGSCHSVTMEMDVLDDNVDDSADDTVCAFLLSPIPVRRSPDEIRCSFAPGIITESTPRPHRHQLTKQLPALCLESSSVTPHYNKQSLITDICCILPPHESTRSSMTCRSHKSLRCCFKLSSHRTKSSKSLTHKLKTMAKSIKTKICPSQWIWSGVIKCVI